MHYRYHFDAEWFSRADRSQSAARQMVQQHASGEPDVLQQDFYHSLLAAFTAEEVEKQLLAAGLSNLTE
jgi:hypothetical protein